MIGNIKKIVKTYSIGDIVTLKSGDKVQILVVTEKLIAFNDNMGLVYWSSLEDFIERVLSK